MSGQIDKYEEAPVNPSDVCQRALELVKTKQFDEAEKLIMKMMSKTSDNVAVGLFHSTLGILYKIKGEPKVAWKHYQRAERLMPDDPALKIIVARLLIDQFAEFDTAIKKVKKVADIVKENPVFLHQAYTTMGLAYLGKGERKKAVFMLRNAMAGDFAGFVSAQNIDFSLVEMLLRAGIGVEECREYLLKAFQFSKRTKELEWVVLTEKMLAAFPKESK